jgi:hypothetical protein
MSGGVQVFKIRRQQGAERAGFDVVIIANYKELYDTLRDLGKQSPLFTKELRKASEEIAQHIVDKAKVNAAGQPKHGPTVRGSSGRSQAQIVVNALRARRDRIPTIKLDGTKLYPSKSRSNAKRTKGKAFGPGMTRKVTMGDVWFGAEFGGRGSKKTQQFLRHRGRQGYFFWQAVRDSKSFIIKEYVQAIDDIGDMLGIGRSRG